jgi:hypothetical protein
VVVRTLAERHIAKTEARQFYEDLTPPPTPDEIEQRRMERVFRAAQRAAPTPDKRQRRALRRLKGRERRMSGVRSRGRRAGGDPGSGKTTFYRARFAGTHVLVSKDNFPNARSRDLRQTH